MRFRREHKYYNYRLKHSIVHKYDKIMFLSCVQISNNKYELTYLLDYVFILNDTKTLIPLKVIVNYEDYKKIVNTKFGIWFRLNNNKFNNNFLYIYRNLNNNRLIFKATRFDNNLNNGFINQYNHELIFKALLSDNTLIEEMG